MEFLPSFAFFFKHQKLSIEPYSRNPFSGAYKWHHRLRHIARRSFFLVKIRHITYRWKGNFKLNKKGGTLKFLSFPYKTSFWKIDFTAVVEGYRSQYLVFPFIRSFTGACPLRHGRGEAMASFDYQIKQNTDFEKCTRSNLLHRIHTLTGLRKK